MQDKLQRAGVIAKLRREITGRLDAELTRDESLALLLQLHGDYQLDAEAPRSAQSARAPIVSDKSGAILRFLSGGTPKIVPEIAFEVYGSDSREEQNKTRSLLKSLSDQGKIHGLVKGQWTVATASPRTRDSDSPKGERLTDLVVRVLQNSSQPLSSGDIIKAARVLRPDANPQSLLATISQLFTADTIQRSGERRAEFRYSVK